jgi:hypothetical protein
MLSTLLIIIAAVVGLAVLLAVGFAILVRRPALITKRARFGPARRLMVRATQAQIRRARKHGDVPAGATDLEVVLAGEMGAEAQAAKAMLARMSPRQRAELSRRTMGADGLAGLMETAATREGDDAGSVGRADRRRAAALAGSAGPSAQQRKAVARRRAARKAGRSR